jgi:hypothetical protein
LHMAFKLSYVYDYIPNYAGDKQKPYKKWKCECSQHWTRRTPTQEIWA